jgi:drug/metabolite transporter superfamily protein YnfA
VDRLGRLRQWFAYWLQDVKPVDPAPVRANTTGMRRGVGRGTTVHIRIPMTGIAHFSIGCAAGVLRLWVGYLLDQGNPTTRAAALMVLLSGLVVAVANSPRGRVGHSAAKGGVLLFFSLVFFELAHWLNASSFDPTPVYGLGVLLLSVASGTVAFLTAAPVDTRR